MKINESCCLKLLPKWISHSFLSVNNGIQIFLLHKWELCICVLISFQEKPQNKLEVTQPGTESTILLGGVPLGPTGPSWAQMWQLTPLTPYRAGTTFITSLGKWVSLLPFMPPLPNAFFTVSAYVTTPWARVSMWSPNCGLMLCPPARMLGKQVFLSYGGK